jgi:2-polyprenyl-3-methyl-5-hydroxy-6-metoxy-1,4-benzoquinol methylase
MTVPEFTKERFYVDHVHMHGIACLQRHVNRYKWAVSLLKPGSVVLDAACGSGYGDFILLNAASKVVGVDVSQEAIDYAVAKAKKQNEERLVYSTVDVSELNYQNQFDHVVSLETIEHMDKAKQEAFVSRVGIALKVGGSFLVSTPVKDSQPTTEYHSREMTRDEFHDLLVSHFMEVNYFDPEKYGIPKHFILAQCSGVKI